MPGEEFLGAMLGGAGISAAGGLASTALGMWGAHRQMQFQERMSSTAYQRQVEDMRKAGINPMLAIGKAGGASTPSGASFTPENPLKEVPGAIGKAAELKLTNARIANETATTQASVQEAAARTKLLQEQANSAAVDTQLKGAELGRQPNIAAKLQADIDNALKELDVKTANIAHSGAATAELQQRTRREKAIADILTGFAPLVTQGTAAINKLIDFLKNPNTSAAKELSPFLAPSNVKQSLLHDGPQWGLLRGPSLIIDRFIEGLREAARAPARTPNVKDSGDRPGMRGGY
jgi:hypothetical protein